VCPKSLIPTSCEREIRERERDTEREREREREREGGRGLAGREGQSIESILLGSPSIKTGGAMRRGPSREMATRAASSGRLVRGSVDPSMRKIGVRAHEWGPAGAVNKVAGALV